MNNSYYSFNNQYPALLPERIRLADGSTLTDIKNIDDSYLAYLGYVKVPFPPEINENLHRLLWVDGTWQTVPLSDQELALKRTQQWNRVLQNRQQLFDMHQWRIYRYESEVRLGLTPTDDIAKLDTYFQALRDITKQEDPYNIIWPEQP